MHSGEIREHPSNDQKNMVFVRKSNFSRSGNWGRKFQETSKRTGGRAQGRGGRSHVNSCEGDDARTPKSIL